MTAPNDLQQRMTELGRRYLERTAAELSDLNTLIESAQSGEAEIYRKIEILAHRIRGSGAMFGFNLISDAAYGVEMLAVDAKAGLHSDGNAVQARFAALARVLFFVVQAALKAGSTVPVSTNS
jgi:HPt (histidine-containing phosphotransfer) domain-containing protein